MSIIDLITLGLKEMRIIHLYLMSAMSFMLLHYLVVGGLNRIHNLFMHHQFVTYTFVLLLRWLVLC